MVYIMQDSQSNVLLDSDIPFYLITGIYKGTKHTSFIYIYIYTSGMCHCDLDCLP